MSDKIPRKRSKWYYRREALEALRAAEQARLEATPEWQAREAARIEAETKTIDASRATIGAPLTDIENKRRMEVIRNMSKFMPNEYVI